MKKSFLVLLTLLCFTCSNAQTKTENLIIITFDGLRWQEFFGGADDSLIHNKTYTHDSANMVQKFWANTPEERRKKLLPFVWTTIAQQGQLYGNRRYENRVNVKNPYRVSYPGYNEIFTGYPDPLIKNNDTIYNKHTTVLEYLNRQPALKSKVAAFTSWNVFQFIFNKKQCSFPVSAGFDKVAMNSPRFDLLNEMQNASFEPFGEEIRPDMLTYFLTKEYIKTKKPKVLFIGFDETDDWAHDGRYDYYLHTANLTDRYIADLWNMLQTMPEYKNKTTLIITCDHGRGDAIKKDWVRHGKDVIGADETWMAFVGKGIAAKGEVKEAGQLYQAQLAQTIAQLLGYNFTAAHPVEKSIDTENLNSK